MYQYDDPTVSATLPAPAAAGTPGYFTDGNPVGGVAATELRSDFMNMIMMELLNVVEAAGETPSKTTYNQVLTAIETLIQQRTGHGQCRLSVASATSLVLKPYNGNSVIVNGVPLQLPSVAISIANTGLAASTVYYVYLAGTTASPSLVLSTTGHVTASNGVEVMSSDATKTLVGMIATNSSSQFVSSGSQMLCLNWFNRRRLTGSALTSSVTTTSTSATELTTAQRVSFLCWGDDVPQQQIYGNFSNSAASVATVVAGYIDSSLAGISQSYSSTTANFGAPFSMINPLGISEGSHVSTVFGNVASASTGTYSINHSVSVNG